MTTPPPTITTTPPLPSSSSPPSSRSSRRASLAGSAYSAAGSTRHMLADYNPTSHSPSPSSPGDSAQHLTVPRYTGLPSGANSPTTSASGVSLSVNYLPAKFSDNILNARARLRGSGMSGGGKKGLVGGAGGVPKTGGGLAAFKSGEGRIGGATLRWTRFKVILCITNTLVLTPSLLFLYYSVTDN